MPSTPLVFIDLETTGTRSTRDRITEIAAMKVVDGQCVALWSSLIQPECKIPPTIARLTGITDALVAEAPTFGQISSDLHAWLGDAPLVAHNARFDYAFLRNAFKQAGIDYRTQLICTLRLSRRLAPNERQHSLSALLARHGLTNARQHRAESDVKALWALWQSWQAAHTPPAWDALLLEERRYRSLPAHLDSAQLDRLPTTPGIYLLYGHNHLPLYVGKSVNLRARVMGHFQRDHQDEKEMRLARQVQHVEWEETAGDLGAQLREAERVKALMPIMNRQLRRQGKLTTWHWPEGDTAPQLVGGSALARPLSGEVYGLFRNARDAKLTLRAIAEEEQLCPQVLGLEKRQRGRCFAYQLKKCRGACCGEESLAHHTQRAKAALEKLRIHAWPWEGRLIIEEHHPNAAQPAWHAIDHWCYLGSAQSLNEARALDAENARFDVDTYRILSRFLRDPATHHLKLIV